ncbi:CVNH domain-containing protein [Sorangium sp. So ce1667]
MNKYFRHVAMLPLGLCVLSLTYSAQAQGDFDLSCQSISYNNVFAQLVAYCRTLDGNYVFSFIELDQCIANANGDLVWTHGGQFSWTCLPCEVDYDGNRPWLECDCLDDNGVHRDTRLPLFQGIINLNGVLGC